MGALNICVSSAACCPGTLKQAKLLSEDIRWGNIFTVWALCFPICVKLRFFVEICSLYFIVCWLESSYVDSRTLPEKLHKYHLLKDGSRLAWRNLWIKKSGMEELLLTVTFCCRLLKDNAALWVNTELRWNTELCLK